jgi:nicotinamidase-related amidase
MFSCRECGALMSQLNSQSVSKVVLAGIEAHVCVLQTALDLLAEGFDVYVCLDATGSRFELDQEVAYRRLELAGATLVTTEMALFEWCESSAVDEFKAISRIVRESGPQIGPTLTRSP